MECHEGGLGFTAQLSSFESHTPGKPAAGQGPRTPRIARKPTYVGWLWPSVQKALCDVFCREGSENMTKRSYTIKR